MHRWFESMILIVHRLAGKQHQDQKAMFLHHNKKLAICCVAISIDSFA
jgi:hypothetical protein